MMYAIIKIKDNYIFISIIVYKSAFTCIIDPSNNVLFYVPGIVLHTLHNVIHHPNKLLAGGSSFCLQTEAQRVEYLALPWGSKWCVGLPLSSDGCRFWNHLVI